ncbi:MAG: Glycosyltransferase PglI [uncultured Acidimicrobiales bacterium]|uniref:Glycosyltransferase PglI n=1 Tax=uncultured Acidimicrobiales bacterium TaxID=310071 RepID=A0A6J4HGV7_9ACTN|nr:MAG: Glycosyltransferase PglI [uncultured Acidimicrobiales bacterium]
MDGCTTPKVSIVTPTYDRMDLLKGAVESGLAQTYADFELIVSDNAMSDEVQALVASYGDDRIKYRHNGSNVGALGNALAAYKAARGTYIGTLHDDDLWEPTFLEKLVHPMEADPSISLAFSDHYIMDGSGRTDVQKSTENSKLWRRANLAPGKHQPFVRLALVDRALPVAMATVFRKDSIDWNDFPPEVASVYDLWLAYLACRNGGAAYYVPERLTRYRHHGGAMTAHSRYDEFFVYCYDRFLSDPRLADAHDAIRREAGPFHTGLGLALVAHGDRARGRRHLARGLRSHPDLRSVSGLVCSALPASASAMVERLANVRRMRSSAYPRA